MRESQLHYFDDKYRRSAQNLKFIRDLELVRLGIDYPMLARLFQSLGLEGARVLDVGCGDEPKTLVLAPDAPVQLVGADLSFEGLALSRERARGYASSFQGVRAAATHLPFADASFDVVVCYKTLEYTYDPRQALEEMSRVLRQEGQLFLCTLNRRYLFRGLYRTLFPRHMREDFLPKDPYFSLPQVRTWFRYSGLSLESCAFPFSFVSGAWDMYLLPSLVIMALRRRHPQRWLRLLACLRPALRVAGQMDRLWQWWGQSSALVVVGRKRAPRSL
jgi:ubiquinone/menaquinone biosynthesis C-methylase UbiE